MDRRDLVKEFHEKFGAEHHDEPTFNDELSKLRFSLLSEELVELDLALTVKDPVAVLDALVDLEYVLLGAVHALGYDKYFDEAFKEIHASNMSKLGDDGKPILREDGKILKGANYFPPDLNKILDKHQ